MPGKKNNRKGHAGNPGLAETADQDPTLDQTMGTEGSSVAAGGTSQQGANLDPGLAAINAFDDLFEQTTDKADKDSGIPPKDSDKRPIEYR